MEDHRAEAAVGTPQVPSAIAAFELLVKAVDVKLAHHPAGALEATHDQIALRVDIGPDVMGHLPGRVTEADAFVEGGGSEPDHPPLTKLVPFPETHMVPLAGAVADRQLKGQILFAAEEKERTHRSRVIRAWKHRVLNDPQTADQRDRVGRIPLCCGQRLHQIRLASLDRDIHRISGMPVRRLRDPRASIERMMAEVPPPTHREQQISSHRPDKQNDANPVETLHRP